MTDYEAIRKIMKNFDKFDAYSKYSGADLFLNVFGKRKKYIFSFITNYYEDSKGIQLFTNSDGFNYIHDIFTFNDENMLLVGRVDSICAVCLDKNLLTEDDIDYLHKMGLKVKKENNLIIYRYQVGYKKRYANKNELKELLRNCIFIDSFISDNPESVTEFNSDKFPISIIFEDKYEYSTTYIPFPNVSSIPRKLPLNEQIIEEFKNLPYSSEECYMFTAYTPLIVQETGVRPLLVYFYFPDKNKIVFKYITDSPKEYKNYIYGILDDVFTKEGLVEKLYINDRNLYAYIYKTLSELNIEVELLFENDDVDYNLTKAINMLYQNSEELYTESKDGIEMVLDLIVTELNSLGEMMSEDDDIKEKIVV